MTTSLRHAAREMLDALSGFGCVGSPAELLPIEGAATALREALNAEAPDRRRVGRFTVTREIYLDGLAGIVFDGLVPTEVRYRVATGNFDCEALGDCFEIVPIGQEPARYTLVLENDWVTTPSTRRSFNHRCRFVKLP